MHKCVDFVKEHKVPFIVGIVAGVVSLLTFNAIRIIKAEQTLETTSTDDGFDEFEDPDISAEE